jgi:hypothetical protein
LRQFHIILQRSPVERGAAIALGRVHIRVLLQERPNPDAISALRGIGEPGIGYRRRQHCGQCCEESEYE